MYLRLHIWMQKLRFTHLFTEKLLSTETVQVSSAEL